MALINASSMMTVLCLFFLAHHSNTCLRYSCGYFGLLPVDLLSMARRRLAWASLLKCTRPVSLRAFFSNSVTGYIQSLSPKSSGSRSEEHTSELQSQSNLVCRLLLEK